MKAILKLLSLEKRKKTAILSVVLFGIPYTVSANFVGDFFSGLVSKAADATIGNLLEGIAFIFYKVAAIFARFGGWLLDESIRLTINSGVYNQLNVVNTGWTTIRDLCNLFFIFILLYIAIRTILQMEGGTKRLLVNVIIAALLINFSLFFTKIIIDVSNVFAVGFYSKIQVNEGNKGVTNSASAALMAAIRLQTTSFDQMTGGQTCSLSNTDKALAYAGGAILFLIAGYIFMAGAFMMMYRSVVLVLCMIFSPLAFIGPILPKFGGEGNSVMSNLISASILAPAYIFMLYLAVNVVNNSGTTSDLHRMSGATGTESFACLLAGAKGSDGSFAIMYSYFLVIIFMLASLVVSKKISAGAANFGTSWAKKSSGVIAGGVLLGAANVGRRVGGRVGAGIAQNERVQKAAKQTGMRGWMARKAISGAETARTSTWDLRNTRTGSKVLGATIGQAGISTGTASSRTFAKTGGMGIVGDDRVERVTKDAERLFPNNPEARKNYIQDKLGKSPIGVITGKERNLKSGPGGAVSSTGEKLIKSANEKADKEIRVNEAKKSVQEKIEKYVTMAPEDRRKIDQETGRTIGEEIARELSKLSGKDYVDFMTSAKYAGPENAEKRAALITHASGQHLSAIGAGLSEGRLTEDDSNEVVKHVMAGGTTSGKRYLQNQFRNGNPNFDHDFQQDHDDAIKARNDALATAVNEDAKKRVREEYNEKVADLLRYQTMEDVGKYRRDTIMEIAPNLNNDQIKALDRNTRDQIRAAQETQTKTATTDAAQRQAEKDSGRFRELLAKLTLTDAEKAELETLRNKKSGPTT